MKKFTQFLVGAFAAALVCSAGVALAAAYNGFNPSTGLEGLKGTLVDNSLDVPLIAQSGQTISAQKGSANTGQWLATGATTGAGTLTFVNAAPTGRECIFRDMSTPADLVTQTTATDGKTVVTIAGTIVSTDVIQYHCIAF